VGGDDCEKYNFAIVGGTRFSSAPAAARRECAFVGLTPDVESPDDLLCKSVLFGNTAVRRLKSIPGRYFDRGKTGSSRYCARILCALVSGPEELISGAQDDMQYAGALGAVMTPPGCHIAFAIRQSQDVTSLSQSHRSHRSHRSHHYHKDLL